MNLPTHYNKRLQRAYPELRMRWSDVRECWLLEQRAYYARLDINPEKYPRDALDTFIQHRDGYFLTGMYAPRDLPNVDRLIQFLYAHDVRRMDLGGGSDADRAARLADMYDARDAAYRAKLKRENSFEHTGAGAELYDQLAWEEKRRVSVPNSGPLKSKADIRFGSAKSREQVPGSV